MKTIAKPLIIVTAREERDNSRPGRVTSLYSKKRVMRATMKRQMITPYKHFL